MKQTLIILALVALVIWGVFASIRPRGETAPEGGEVIELLYWGLDNDVYVNEVLQEFERRNPGIRVIFGQSAAVNRTTDPQRILTAVAGGFPPDVIEFDRFAVGEWANRGAFMPLQPLLEHDLVHHPTDPLTIRPENYYEPTWAEANLDGTLYAIPISTDNRALYYNKVLLERAGYVDERGEADPPDTWEELAEMAVALSEMERNAKGKVTDLRRAGFLPIWGNSYLYMYGWMNGAKFMSDDGRTCLLNSPEVVEALDFIVQIYNSIGGAEQVNKFQATFQGNELDPFLTGRVAMRIDGNALMNVIANYNPDLDFGVIAPPLPADRLAAGAPKISWSGGFALIIPRGAKHPDEAWQLIKFLASPIAADIRAEAERTVALSQGQAYIPQMNANRVTLRNWYEKYVLDEPSIQPKFKEAFRTHMELLPVSHFRPVTPVGQLLWNQQETATDLAINHHQTGITPREALDHGAAIVQKRLNEIYNPTEGPILSWNAILGVYMVLILLVIGVFYRRHRRHAHARGYFAREYRAGIVFALPWFIGFIVFTGGPILFSLVMAFAKYDILTPPQFIGFKHFHDLFFNDPLFWKSLWNTIYMTLGIPLGMAAGLAIALLLNHEIRGIAVYRTLFYLPAIMPAVAASILWVWIFNPSHGILNEFLAFFGLPRFGWLQNADLAKPALILMGLWGAGASMIIWLAGLKGIPDQLYDAARVDGANAWQRFWSVTLPMLSPYVLFNLIMGVIGTFQIFTQAYVMTQGGPVNATLFYVYHLFNNAFRYLTMGYASAMAWILFVIIFVLTLVQLRLSKRWVHYTAD